MDDFGFCIFYLRQRHKKAIGRNASAATISVGGPSMSKIAKRLAILGASGDLRPDASQLTTAARDAERPKKRSRKARPSAPTKSEKPRPPRPKTLFEPRMTRIVRITKRNVTPIRAIREIRSIRGSVLVFVAKRTSCYRFVSQGGECRSTDSLKMPRFRAHVGPSNCPIFG